MFQIRLINNERKRIKEFKNFNAKIKEAKLIEIECDCFYKKSLKQFIKGYRIETIEEARKLNKDLLKERWKKTSIFNYYF